MVSSGCYNSPESVHLSREIGIQEVLDGQLVGEGEIVYTLRKLHRSSAPLQFYQHLTYRNPIELVEHYRTDGLAIRDNPILKPMPPIDWGANPTGDDNWLFQKNALYMLGPTLQAHQQTADEVYLFEALSVLLDWIEYNIAQQRDNPYKWDDMGTGLRAVALAYVLDAGLRASTFESQQIEVLLHAAIIHLINLMPPAKLATGNHAYFQLAGIAALCHAVPELKRCDAALQYVDREFDQLVLRQFSNQGMHREHAPDYHLFSLRRLDKLLETGWFNLSNEAVVRLERARTLRPWLRHPNGMLAMIGDSARGQLRQGEFDAIIAANPDPTEFGKNLAKSGYAILRSDWHAQPASKQSYLLFWAGDEQPTSSPNQEYGHSHADNFTFEWSSSGIPVILDSGKYSYGLDAWRKYFVSTRAHNTVEIDAESLENVTRPGISPGITQVYSGSGIQFIDARVVYDNPVISHRRLLVLKPNAWLVVVDLLQGIAKHRITQWFHFHEEWVFEKVRGGGLQGRGFGRNLQIQSLSPTPVDPQLYRGVVAPRIQGWISSKYLEKTDNAAVALTVHGQQAELVTLLRWQADEETGPVSVQELAISDSVVAVCWQSGTATQGFKIELNKNVQPVEC